MENTTSLDLEENIESKIEGNIMPPNNIVVINDVKSAADLFRLMEEDGAIDVQPDFQRSPEAWKDSDRARFIDSLSKEFPIPSMCFALDPKIQKFIVIDGLQRMTTIKKFLGDPSWILPKLTDVDERLSGNTVINIKNKYPQIFRKIQNISLPVTILRYDPNLPNNMEYIFTIFQRLNTGGVKLNNQEIRNAVFQGPFNSFIKDCSKKQSWEKYFKYISTGSKNIRMLSEEKVLRFMAFFEKHATYSGKLNMFLNEYMLENRSRTDTKGIMGTFDETINQVVRLGVEKVGKVVSINESVLFAVANNLAKVKEYTGSDFSRKIELLRSDDAFNEKALGGGLMQKNKVNSRLSVANKIFAQ